MNKVLLIGRLTKDPEKKSTDKGTSVVSFSVAVQRKYKNADGNYDADYINCVAWRTTADFIANYFTKGQRIGVVGSLTTRSYEVEGKKRFVTEVNVDEAEFVESKEKKTEPKQTDLFEEELKDFKPLNDADLPF